MKSYGCLVAAVFASACHSPESPVQKFRSHFPERAALVLGDSNSGFERTTVGYTPAGESAEPVPRARALASGAIAARFPLSSAEPIRFISAGFAVEVREEEVLGEGEL